jgi:hypothetical protein
MAWLVAFNHGFHRIMIRVMDDKHDPWFGLTIVDVLLIVTSIVLVVGPPMVVITVALGSPVPEVCGAGLGAMAVFLIVRHFNRCYDPRRQNHPPDAP